MNIWKVFCYIFSSCLFCSFSTVALDDSDSDLSETVELVDIDILEALPKISEVEVRNDLNDIVSARFQMDANLKLFREYANYDQHILQLPMLCIATGRNIQNMKFKHTLITTVREADKCLDLCGSIEPDYVCDCFNLVDLFKLNIPRFGSVFFAHVQRMLDVDIDTIRALEFYKNKLDDGGLLVYNSGVIHENVLNDYYLDFQVKNFEEIEIKWRTMLKECGFKNIQIMKKSEEQYFPALSVSILIIAQAIHRD